MITKLKNWISDFKHNRNHNRNAKRLNSEIEKRYYNPKTNTILKILSELDKKAGLSPYDIVPYLIKINLMSVKGSMIEKGNEFIITDKKRNTELFNRIEKLEYIEIIENKLYSTHSGIKYPTPTKESVLKIRLLPKGIDYLQEQKRKIFDKRLRIVLACFSAFAFFISIYNLKKPTHDKFDKLENKVDSISNDIEKMKEKQLKPIKKQLEQED